MAKDDPLELEIPGEVTAAKQSVELLRAWIADGALVLSLESSAFGDQVADWGRLLAEISHHVAKAQALNGAMSEEEALQDLKAAFDRSYPVHSRAMSGKIKGRIRH